MNVLHPDQLREQRTNPSVLKVALAKLRERHRCRIVVVIEGKDDLPIYENWFGRIRENYEWEPLVAKGKKLALEFRDLLKRDRTGLAVCTYFIVDHDYDALRGRDSGDDVFVVPAYSVENFLVEDRVLESYLRTELRVIADPAKRDFIVGLYRRARDEFIELVKPACEILYGARNEKVGNIRVGDVGVALFLENGEIVVRRGGWVDRLVSSDLPVSEEGIVRAQLFFESRELLLWIRGKFMLDFFRSFCEVLYSDRVSEEPKIFDAPISDRALSAASLDLRNLVPKARIPEGLSDALHRWERNCAESCTS